MEARRVSALEFLREARQFSIPACRDTYKWKKDQCAQLWDDIIRVAKNPGEKSLFFGPITYVREGGGNGNGASKAGDVPRLLLVDGQQRLVTLTLLLAALAKSLEIDDNAEITPDVIRSRYLFNHTSGDAGRKLLLRRDNRDNDDALLAGILNDVEQKKRKNSRIVLNHIYFQRRLGEGEIDPDVLYSGMCKLEIIEVALDQSLDNPQLVLEGLNHKGLDLDNAALIRNYLMLKLDEKTQEYAYSETWPLIEADTEAGESPENFDLFMECYLAARMGTPTEAGGAYPAFKRHLAQAGSAEVLGDMQKMARFFRRIALQKDEPDEDLKQTIQDMHHMDVRIAYPFLMGVYSDYDAGLLSKDEILEIFLLMESYMLRRIMCYVDPITLDKMLAGLPGEIDKGRYLDSFKALICTKTASNRFPPDKEFLEKIVGRHVCDTQVGNYLLSNIERRSGGGWVRVGDYAVEHIIQEVNVSESEWRDGLGQHLGWKPEHYLHTVGNLTLADSNPEAMAEAVASGRWSFLKRRGIKGRFADSPLWLNRDLAGCERWNGRAILERGEMLARRAVEIWPYPDAPTDMLHKYSKIAKAATAAAGAGGGGRGSRAETYSEDQYLKRRASAKMRRIYLKIKPYLLDTLSGLEFKARKSYLGMYSDDGSLTCEIRVGQNQLTVYYTTKNPVASQMSSLIKKYAPPSYDTWAKDWVDPDELAALGGGGGGGSRVPNILESSTQIHVWKNDDGTVRVSIEIRDEGHLDDVFSVVGQAAKLDGF